MGAEFEEILVEGQLFRRYTKRDNLPFCRFVEGKARALTEISTLEKPKKGRLSRDTAGDVKRNADIYTVAGKNLKIELTKNLPENFDWKASDVEDKLESNREALANCLPDGVSMELKEGLMDILNQNVLLQKMSVNQLEACIDKADRNLVVTPTPKSWSIVFTDANTAEITEVAEVRSYFTVDDYGNPIGKTKNALEKGPAFLTITTTQRVSIVEGELNVNYTQMTNEVQVSEERLCNAVDSLLSDESLGLVDSNLMNRFHAIGESNASSSIKAFAKHITETMKYGYPSWQKPEDRNKTGEYLAELEQNLLKLQKLEQAGFTDMAALSKALSELVCYSDLCDRHMNLSASNSFYAKIGDSISNLDTSQYVKACALFAMVFEHQLQTLGAICTAGKQFFAEVIKAGERASTEEKGYLATVVNYGTKQLQHLVEPTVQSSSALPSKAQKCSDEEYQDAKMKLQGKYDKVVSSATKFLEAVATALMEKIIFTVMAFANSGPSLSFVPFLLGPCANSLIDRNCGGGQTEKMGRDSNGGFFGASKSSKQPEASARVESKGAPQLLLSK